MWAAYKPDSVNKKIIRSYSSRIAVTSYLKQPTRQAYYLHVLQEGCLAKKKLSHASRLAYLVLLLVGFTMHAMLPQAPVRSYRTFSPLPSCLKMAVSFLLHFPSTPQRWLAVNQHYFSLESGLS